MIRNRIQLSAAVVFMILLMWGSASANVNVYAEGAYTATNLVVYIYADVTDTPLVSYGVKLAYDPDEVDSPSVVKDNSVWYFGSAAAPLPTPNAEPDVSTPGEVVIVGGKINEAAPAEGVIGSRKRIAVVTFNRVDPATPPFIVLSPGKGGSYANFVQVDGTLLDAASAPAFEIGTVAVHKRGDANKDGNINIVDMGTVKNMVLNSSYSIWADANGDGVVNIIDMGQIKNIILNN